MAAWQDRVGQRIGDYQLVRRLNSGTFGTVYFAEQVGTGAGAAVKVLHLHLTGRDDFRDFLNEARAIRLRHPHIVTLLDFGVTRDDVPFLVMEYAAGGTVRDRYPRRTPLPLEMIDLYVQQVASALQYAHDQRVIHRDIKPENMLLRDERTLLLSDFGIAKILESQSASSRGTSAGTPTYMAPEQSMGHPVPASDQYALATVVYEWISGQPPFRGGPLEMMMQHQAAVPPPLGPLRSDLPMGVEAVVFKALSKKPEERYVSVEAFAQALQSTSRPYTQTMRSTREEEFPSSQRIVPPPRVITPMFAELPPVQSKTQADDQSRPAAKFALSNMQSKPTDTPRTLSSMTRTSPQLLEQSERDRRGKEIQHAGRTTPRKNGRLVLTLILVLLVVIGSSIGGYALITGLKKSSDVNVTATTVAKDANDKYNAAVNANGTGFGFDAAHTHWNPYEKILNAANVSHLSLLWSFQTGARIGSWPAVANGVVYVGSYDGKLYAFGLPS